MSGRVLVVDDDRSIRETFEHHLGRLGYEVQSVDSAETALARLSAIDPAVVVTDVRMSEMDGLELLRHLRERDPGLDVVVITAHEDMRSAITAMKEGAYEYLVKPLDLDEIERVLERCFRDRRLRRVRELAGDAARPGGVDQLVGRDPAMIGIYKTIGALARTRAPVLILGETGTGKERIARAIHLHSDAAEEPFVAINCTALSEPLLESELFGHVRGAFTGATADRRGRFELAGAGTVFLDEIGDVSPAFQAKLLRVLQEREFERVGDARPIRTDARVVAATHRDLAAMVAEGRFREDLYFRLRVVEIRVPPLRERRDDIPLLVEHLLTRIAADLHRRRVVVSDRAMARLIAYDWPGNVRELENALTRALVLSPGDVLQPDALRLGPATAGAASSSDADPVPADDSLDAAEAAQVRRVLARTAGNKSEAARILRISRPRLDRLIVKHGLAATERDRS